MGNRYTCTFADCGMVFRQAFELKKHTATHEDPDRVYYCSECDFITLQKKNLRIHFAIHTGEKIHHCLEIVSTVKSSGSPTPEERCEFRTNDPAALTRHRKKVHGYIPPPSRTRARKVVPATIRKPRQRKDRTVSLSALPPLVSYPTLSHLPETLNTVTSAVEHSSVPTSSLENTNPFLWQDDLYRQLSIASSPSNTSGYESLYSSNEMVAAPKEEMDLNSLYDPTLDPAWMAQYEMSYSKFDVTGMKYHPAAPISYPTSLDVPTGREGCLCPDWMVEAGIEGWDQSILDAHKETYTFDV